MQAITPSVVDARSLALHRGVARRLRDRPELLEVARARVRAWREDEDIHPHWIEVWSDILSRPLDEIIEVITDPGEQGAELRQASPFAGVLDPRTRWEILRSHTDHGNRP
jgi:hypothetical protein